MRRILRMVVMRVPKLEAGTNSTECRSIAGSCLQGHALNPWGLRMHFELLPSWLVLAPIGCAALLLINILMRRRREKSRRDRRTKRRRRNIAQHRTWEWLTELRKPKPLRLRDDRKPPEER